MALIVIIGIFAVNERSYAQAFEFPVVWSHKTPADHSLGSQVDGKTIGDVELQAFKSALAVCDPYPVSELVIIDPCGSYVENNVIKTLRCSYSFKCWVKSKRPRDTDSPDIKF